MKIKVKCSYKKLVPVSELQPNPKNPNKHSPEQIRALAHILKYQGIRKAITVSNQSGLMVTGHGTLEAIKLNGWKQAPVDPQDFEDAEQEYAHLVADNGLGGWAELDLAAINAELPDLGPDFDISMLGIEGFTLDPSDHAPAPIHEDKVTSGEVPEGSVTKIILFYSVAEYPKIVSMAAEACKSLGCSNLSQLFSALLKNEVKS